MKMLYKKMLGVCFAGLLGMFMSVSAVGQGCLNTSQWPTLAVSPDGSDLTTISTCQFLQEYSIITGIQSGEDYEFTVTGSGYITVRTDSAGGAVLGMGASPLTVTAGSSGDLYVHWNTDSSCGTDTGCQTSTVQCASCPKDCPILDLNIGDPCDDGDPNTLNDTVNSSCVCEGQTPPANDDCADATSLTCGNRVYGDTYLATSSGLDPECNGFSSFDAWDVWYSFTADGTSDYTVTVYADTSFWDGVLHVYSGTCGSLTSVGCSDSSFSGGDEAVMLTAPAAGTYYVRLYDYFGGDKYSVEVECSGTPPCADPFPAATGLSAAVQGNGVLFSWNPVAGQIGCQFSLSPIGGSTAQVIIAGAGASSQYVPGQYLSLGTEYTYGVRCGCSQSPLVAGPWVYSTFTTPGSPIVTSSPNPTSDVSNVTFSVVEEGTATLAVYDMTGRMVKTLYTGDASPESEYRFTFDGSDLPAGVYIYRLTTNSETVIEKFMISK